MMAHIAPGTLCPICGGRAHLAFTKEANVSCADYFEGRRLFPENRGAVDVRTCDSCGFAWMPAMHAWPPARFAAEIYNSDYVLCDPHFHEIRPQKLAAWLAPRCAGRSLLDYGGGAGRLAALLAARGISAQSYDPFHGQTLPPSGRFDIVTAIEVIEHAGAQRPLFAALTGALKRDGVLIFSTLLQKETLAGDWWYASARNGHISLHSAQSLAKVLAGAGLHGLSLSREFHLAAHNPAVLEAWRTPIDLQISGTPGFQTAPPWQDFTAA